MDIKNYLINKINEEPEIVLELLNIDNRICQQNLTMEKLIEALTEVSLPSLDGIYNFWCDGEIKSVFNILIHYPMQINKIHLSRYLVAINSYLIKRVLAYLNLDDDVIDLNADYHLYKDDETPIIIVGSKEFCAGIREIVTKSSKKSFIVD